MLSSLRSRANGGAIVMALASTFFAGCAPIWPTLMTDRELRSRGGPELNCHLTVADTRRAYECLNAAREEFQKGMSDIGRYNRSLGFTALAGGTAAGYQVAKSEGPNTSLLKNLGVALAALVGFDKVVSADNQHQVLTAGNKALLCIEQAARGAQATKQNVERAAVQKKGLFAISSMNAGGHVTTIDDATRSMIQRQLEGQRLLAIAAGNDLVRAAQAAADEPTLAERIRIAVIRIRSEVLVQLSGNRVDLRVLYSEQQQRVSDILADVIKKAQDTQPVVNLVNAYLIAQQSEPQQGSADEVRPATVAFETCVATLPR